MFQTLVIKDFINQQNTDQLKSAYEKFIAHFHNADIQTHIKNSKEEQYQEGFLRDLFVNILGYTLNPKPNFNLKTEVKNQKGAKKCDGAILKNDSVICVVELKGMDTTNLDKIESQAFGYKNNQMGCRYVITSNFQKLRFYIDNSVEYLEFDLFKLSFDEFCLLYTLLYVDNLLNDIPPKIKTSQYQPRRKNHQSPL